MGMADEPIAEGRQSSPPRRDHARSQFVARIERSEASEIRQWPSTFPDFAPLNPGYIAALRVA